MGVDLHLGNDSHDVGAPDFLHSFFSTISGNLEPLGWGSRFPVLLNELYGGQLDEKHAENALSELESIVRELAALPPERVIWDIEDRSKKPPWGDEIASEITSLANYFVTSAGEDLIELLRDVLTELCRSGGVLRIE